MGLFSNTWFVSIKSVFFSIGVITIALLLKLYLFSAFEFSVSKAPLIWNSVVSWLQPPYIYVVTNGIIISIIATSSWLHNHNNQSEETHDGGDDRIKPSENCAPPMISEDSITNIGYGTTGFEVVETVNRIEEIVDRVPPVTMISEDSTKVFDYETVEVEERLRSKSADEVVVEEEKSVVLVSEALNYSSTLNPLIRLNSSEFPPEYFSPAIKPLVSSRFVHRKPIKTSPEAGKPLRVNKPKRHDTLESTWKTITEGRSVPLTRHLKKSDTMEKRGRHIDPSAVKKSETFKDRTNLELSSVAKPIKLRKEPSMSQDELNRRVESFINKFNEEMRLQRLESLKQYKEMMSRGV